MATRSKATAETADRKQPALALSGGGFRATLFHCGALLRLNELGLLSKMARISSVSGGSVTNGVLALQWSKMTLQNDVFLDLESKVIQPVRSFCKRNVDQAAIGFGAITPGKSVGDVLADVYDEHLFQGATLQDLPDAPQFLFNATNLQTGRLVRMQKVRVADYSIGEIKKPDWRLATVVAASSAFPPVLSPVDIKIKRGAWSDRPGTHYFGNPEYSNKLSLTDGGVYDNLGLETVEDFQTVVVSDAGAPFSAPEESSSFWPKQAMRSLDIATDQARALRKRLLFSEAAQRGGTVVFAGIDSDARRYPKPPVIPVGRARTAEIARYRTRLNKFSDTEQGRLINWGWLIMDTAIRSYWLPTSPAPKTLPLPRFGLQDS